MATTEELLRRANEALMKAGFEKQQMRLDEDRKFIVSKVGKDLTEAITPTLERMANENASFLRDAINEIKQIKIPDIVLPDISVPEPRVSVDVDLSSLRIPEPKISVSPILKPEIKFPDEMDIKGWVQLQGVNLDNPLPVQLRDANGKPVNLLENLTTIVGGSGGGHKITKISDIANSAYGVLINSDGRLRMSAETGSTGLTDTELRASAVPVSQVSGANWSVTASATDLDIRELVNASDSVSNYQVSGATWSVSVNDAFRTTVASNLINSDDRLRVSLETGGTGLTDTELRATSVPVSQVSGANWSVNVQDVFATTVASTVVNPDNRVKVEVVGTQVVSATDLDVRDLVNATDSVSNYQVSGANWSVNVTNIDLDIRDLVNSTDSVSAYQVSGANWSVSVTENKAEDVAHASGDTGFMALSVRNSTNTTFAADGDYQPIATDGIGRPIIRPVQTRGLLQTAYVSITGGAEATLLAGATGIYFDLVYVMATNSSDAAVTVDLRSATAAGIQTSIRVPANGTAGVSMSVPIPQDVAADTWTVDMPDISGTTVTLGALFSREV